MEMLHRIGQEGEFIVYASLLLLLGIARWTEGSRMTLFLRAFSNANLVDQQLRQERAFTRMALIAFVLVIGTLSAFIANALHHFGRFMDFGFIGLMLVVMVGLMLITTARVAVYALAAWLFELDPLQQQHSFHWLLNNFILCLFLLPVLVMVSFAPDVLTAPLVYIGLGACVFTYAARVVRMAGITHTVFRIPVHYNFIYICTLEILPPILMIVMISRQIGG